MLGGKGRPPPTNFGIRKLESLGYRMVKKIAENFNRLSRAHQRHRQTTDRRQTDGSAIAYSEREREFTSANKTTLCIGYVQFFVRTDHYALVLSPRATRRPTGHGLVVPYGTRASSSPVAYLYRCVVERLNRIS